MIRTFSLPFLAVTLVTVGCQKDTPPGPGATATSAAAPIVASTAKASTSAPTKQPPKKGTGIDVGKVATSQLPGIDELYAQAHAAGVVGELPKTINVKAKDFKSMKPASRSIEVGMFLADLAIASSDESRDISPVVIDDAQKAIDALEPPAELQKLVADVVTEAKKGLKGKELRKLVDKMIAKGVPMIEADASKVQSARLVRLGAFLRTMARLSKVLETSTEPNKLMILSQRPDVTFHSETLTSLPADMKGEPLVKKADEALQKSSPAMTKDAPTSDDAKTVAAAFAAFSN